MGLTNGGGHSEQYFRPAQSQAFVSLSTWPSSFLGLIRSRLSPLFARGGRVVVLWWHSPGGSEAHSATLPRPYRDPYHGHLSICGLGRGQ